LSAVYSKNRQHLPYSLTHEQLLTMPRTAVQLNVRILARLLCHAPVLGSLAYQGSNLVDKPGWEVLGELAGRLECLPAAPGDAEEETRVSPCTSSVYPTGPIARQHPCRAALAACWNWFRASSDCSPRRPPGPLRGLRVRSCYAHHALSSGAPWLCYAQFPARNWDRAAAMRLALPTFLGFLRREKPLRAP
jgi:hypothetical protein